jgi:hypothetical protein
MNDGATNNTFEPKASTSNTTMAAAEKKLANCMGRPPLWFVQMVIQVMKRNGLQV